MRIFFRYDVYAPPQRIIFALPPCIPIMKALENLSGTSSASSEQHVAYKDHKELRPARQNRDITHLVKFISWLKTHNPKYQTKLTSVFSDMSADETINCDRADEVGSKLQKAMVGKKFAELTPKRSAKVLPLSAMTSTIKVRGEAVVIDQQQMLNRVLAVHQSGSELYTFSNHATWLGAICVCVAVGCVRVVADGTANGIRLAATCYPAGWCAAPPSTTEGLADVSWLGHYLYKRCVSGRSLFTVLCSVGTHIPSWLRWCVLCGHNLLLKVRCLVVGLPGLVCRIFWPWLTTAMDDSSYGELVRKYVDDYYSMRSSNDNDQADPVGLSSLGVVDLYTSSLLEDFGLWAFDSREPISRMLPGQFPNELRVLIPDAGTAPVAFHDIVMTDLGAPRNGGPTGSCPVRSLCSGNAGRRFYLPPCTNDR